MKFTQSPFANPFEGAFLRFENTAIAMRGNMYALTLGACILGALASASPAFAISAPAGSGGGSTTGEGDGPEGHDETPGDRPFTVTRGITDQTYYGGKLGVSQGAVDRQTPVFNFMAPDRSPVDTTAPGR